MLTGLIYNRNQLPVSVVANFSQEIEKWDGQPKNMFLVNRSKVAYRHPKCLPITQTFLLEIE